MNNKKKRKEKYDLIKNKKTKKLKMNIYEQLQNVIYFLRF
jgi:hypothetical protein